MKCPCPMIIAIALALASAPVPAQVTPRAPRTPPLVEAPPVPDATPRAFDDIDAASDLARLKRRNERDRAVMERTIERQRVIEDDRRELQEQQLERQQELEQRQRELIDAQIERQRAWAPAVEDDAFSLQRAPEAWDRSDPADSLYRAAREALNRGDYRRAAQLFNDLARRYPTSSYAYVSGYYEAFSRYRIGTTEELEAAERALEALSGRSAPPSRGWRDQTDVNGLRTRIRGALAMRGDASAAEKVEETARQAGSSCDQEDLMVRVEALNALSQMDAAAAMPILRRVMERRDECLVELRR